MDGDLGVTDESTKAAGEQEIWGRAVEREDQPHTIAEQIAERSAELSRRLA
ncbi:Uncharacterised protein [Mycobacteroides abscessus subsp. massiliense]|nr:Uncharacterised protein [Mycobacteroides abscessus subsp. abscessus]SKJ21868.1 Uncharacterised protein [Mycobacteroides abscessus subsp. massiliense]SKJ82004.1 Uncharacterised protein [Mycobacteroides abscessus subsp. massiliense]SKK40926.1 Uncharacterised protein [Mycobacteroides abscessus subsp. massiliense]SKR64564.1 Uncharacterised protein [Mycobacteroides abscessus subsp. massiliense]